MNRIQLFINFCSLPLAKIKNKPVLFLGPVFALFFVPVLFSEHIPSISGAYSDQRLLLSLLSIAAIFLCFVRLSYKGRLVSALLDLWPFLLLVCSFLIAVLQHHSGLFYLAEPVFYMFYVLAFGISGYVIGTEGLVQQAAEALLIVVAAACFFYAAMTITVYLFAITDNFSPLDHVIPWGFVNIRYWSHIATWVLPLFPLFLLVVPCKRKKLWRLGAAFTGAMWWWVLFLSSSRGSMVGLLIGFVLVWVCFGRAALPWITLFVRFALYGVGTWLILSLVIPGLVFDEVQLRELKADSSGRMPLWQEAWAMSLQNFPFGMGPQSWLTHDILTDAYHASPKFGHPHNMYLMWAAEYGWISIAGLVLLGGFALRHLWCQIAVVRSGQVPNGLLLAAFTAAVLSALVHAGVSAVFIAPGSMLVGLPILIVFWALMKPVPAQSAMTAASTQSRLARMSGYAVAVVFLAGSAFWFCDVLNYRKAMVDDIDYYQNEVSLGNLPRFWFHGYFPRPASEMPSQE
ncbi:MULTISPECIES: O-antigen ligase family protein [Marinobacter]|uniref:O-antigen ligase family protein n=1 Tax=Marinobacter TaxID=2742 RepID=UPI00326728EE